LRNLLKPLVPIAGNFGTASSRRKAANWAETGYNSFMLLALFAMRVLEIMFFVGLVGSTVVVLISFVEDGVELFGKDEPPQPRA
jgi:hypothetical protein